jgi:hypothetical protein
MNCLQAHTWCNSFKNRQDLCDLISNLCDTQAVFKIIVYLGICLGIFMAILTLIVFFMILIDLCCLTLLKKPQVFNSLQ